ncbi:MAG: outer membrane beta-barrel protein, partial [Acidiferrobacteraceae bacterium]
SVMGRDAFYLGAGLNENSVSGWGTATGFQVFGGYDFGRINGRARTPIDFSMEAGYMNTGDFQRLQDTPYGPVVVSNRYQGPWINGVFSLPVNQEVSLLGRVGVDAGDDSGLMGGLGVGINLNRQMQVRFEYVSRQTVDSLQANLVFYPD